MTGGRNRSSLHLFADGTGAPLLAIFKAGGSFHRLPFGINMFRLCDLAPLNVRRVAPADTLLHPLFGTGGLNLRLPLTEVVAESVPYFDLRIAAFGTGELDSLRVRAVGSPHDDFRTENMGMRLLLTAGEREKSQETQQPRRQN